ncbi:hypothetical protein ACFY8P_12820 [Streptomyces sp. NPDC012693]|uniref:hypothetical protein n=1 Tax=Streptomyces sp. NPDC012693 TaxID=3364844 RepID=UPI00369084CF
MRDDIDDPCLRSLFRAAADHGRRHATPLPVAQVVERGRRSHRRRVALALVSASAVAALGVVTAVGLVPEPSGPVLPATSPSAPLPGPTTSPPPGPLPTETDPGRTSPPSTPGTTTLHG